MEKIIQGILKIMPKHTFHYDVTTKTTFFCFINNDSNFIKLIYAYNSVKTHNIFFYIFVEEKSEMTFILYSTNWAPPYIVAWSDRPIELSVRKFW